VERALFLEQRRKSRKRKRRRKRFSMGKGYALRRGEVKIGSVSGIVTI
jgi:hypothetical protein